MPIFKTETAYFDGEKITLRWKVNTKGVFSLDLPQAMYERLQIKPTIEDDDFETLVKLWKGLLQDYIDAQTSTRKVIAYLLELKGEIYTDANPHQPTMKRDDISFAKGLAVALAVGVFTEETVHSDNGTRSRLIWEPDNELPSSIRHTHFDYWDLRNGDVKVIDWTAEREQFFVELGLALEDLAIKLNNFLAPDALLKAIEAGVRLLPKGDQ